MKMERNKGLILNKWLVLLWSSLLFVFRVMFSGFYCQASFKVKRLFDGLTFIKNETHTSASVINKRLGYNEVYWTGYLYVFGVALGQDDFLSHFFKDGGIIGVGGGISLFVGFANQVAFENLGGLDQVKIGSIDDVVSGGGLFTY